MSADLEGILVEEVPVKRENKRLALNGGRLYAAGIAALVQPQLLHSQRAVAGDLVHSLAEFPSTTVTLGSGGTT